MTEAELQAGIEGALTAGGWLYHHDVSATRLGYIATHTTGHSGWPDIVAVHPERRIALVLELKSDTGRVEPLQQAWLDAWRSVGLDVRVLRPADYTDELIEWLVGPRLVGQKRRRRAAA